MAQKETRVFKEVDVGGHVLQTPEERCQAASRENIILPTIAVWRMCLTALSQKYNLYFTASKNTIHVTVPRDVRQRIPGVPDIRITLPVTRRGLLTRGCIDPFDPHSVNRLLVGNLGTYEIILIACDDGDVIAYYTHLINKEIMNAFLAKRKNGADCKVLPLFHENVGLSAWGLAIHTQSRLIAVSSNLRELSVFAFALRPAQDANDTRFNFEESDQNRKSNLPLTMRFPACMESNWPKSAIDKRERGYKLVFDLEMEADNIPAIDFTNGFNGAAHSIIATDIGGKLFSIPLWQPIMDGMKYQLYPRFSKEFQKSMGWGVLVLDLQQFKVESTPGKTWGTLDLKNIFRPHDSCLVISDTVDDVYDPTISTAKLDFNIEFEEGDLFKSDSDDMSELGSETHSTNTRVEKEFLTVLNRFSSMSDCKSWEEIISDAKSSAELSTVLTAPASTFLLDGSAIIRTNRSNIELVPPTKEALSTVLINPFSLQNTQRNGNPTPFIEFNRINMLHAIPELSLIVIASQFGRAALITLTRWETENCYNGPNVGMRLDWRLPFKYHRQMDMPLLGLAVSPVWEGGDKEGVLGDGKGKAKRWRILLHYYNHCILSYEVWRGGEGDLLIA